MVLHGESVLFSPQESVYPFLRRGALFSVTVAPKRIQVLRANIARYDSGVAAVLSREFPPGIVYRQDDPLRIKHGNAHRQRIDDIDGEPFTFLQLYCQLFRHLLRLSPAVQGAEQDEQQKGYSGAAGQGEPYAEISRGEESPAVLGETERPKPATGPNLSTGKLFAPKALLRSGGSFIQKALGRGAHPVKELKAKPRLFFHVVPAEYPLHQVVHPIGTVDPPQERGAALRYRFNGEFFAIDGEIDEDAGLNVGGCFLNQNSFAGECGVPRIPRLFHGQPAHRFRKHVVTDSPQVSPCKRFQIDDGRVELAIAGRFNRVLGELFTAQFSDVPGNSPTRYQQRKPDPLNAGELLFNLQGADILTPLLPRDVLRCVE